VINKQWGAWAVACVWFTTHFGGGFASGRQLIDFYVKYGWYAIFTPIVSVAIMTLVLHSAWSFSVREKVYDYRSWSVAYFKPFGVLEPFFSVIIEIMYLIILLLATAVAFSTGGSLITRMFPYLPYNMVTLVLAFMIFVFTIWGAEIVRRSVTIMGVTVIIGIFIVYVSNLSSNLSKLAAVVGSFPSANGGFWDAMWQSVKYAGLQSSLIGAYTAVADSLHTQKDVNKAAFIGFVVTVSFMLLAATGILTHYPDILTETVPITYVTERSGTAGTFGVIIVTVIILLALVSTGVGLIYGGARRISNWWVKRTGTTNTRKADVVASAVYVMISWGIASFGLIRLISQGYVWVGTLSTPLVVIPVILVGFIHARRAGK